MYDDYFKNIMGGNIKSPEYYVSTYDNRTYEPRQVNALSGYDYATSNQLNEYNDLDEDKILELYPDIYKIVTPMIDKLLNGKTVDNINENMLVNWTVEIYDALEVDDENTTVVNKNNGVTSNGVNTTNKTILTQGLVGNTTNSTARLTSTQGTVGNVNNNTSKPVSIQGLVGNTTNNTTKSTLNQGAVSNSNNTVKPNSNYESETTSVKITVKNPEPNIAVNTEPKVIDVVARYRNYKNPLLRDLIRILILNRLFGNRRPPRPRPYQDFEPRFMSMPNYSNVNTEVYKPYTDYTKTYLDTPYPEE